MLLMLGPHAVEVTTVSEGLGEDCGEANIHANTISIDQGLAPTTMVETVLHEVVHFLLSGLPLPGEAEEMVACVLGRGLADFIRDNPEWVKLFQDTFRDEENKLCQKI